MTENGNARLTPGGQRTTAKPDDTTPDPAPLQRAEARARIAIRHLRKARRLNRNVPLEVRELYLDLLREHVTLAEDALLLAAREARHAVRAAIQELFEAEAAS